MFFFCLCFVFCILIVIIIIILYDIGKVEYISTLLEHHSKTLDPYATNPSGLSPVESACLNGQLDVLRLLAKENGKVFWFWKDENPLFQKILEGDFEGFKELLWIKKKKNESQNEKEKEKENEKIVDKTGSDSIQSSIEYEYEYECDCNHCFIPHISLFYVLCSCGLTGYVEEILKREDLDPNSLDSKKRSPFSTATQNGHVEMVKLLLKNPKVDVNLPDIEKISPLSIASHNCHYEVIQLLLKDERVDLSINDAYDLDAFEISCGQGDEKIVKLFLDCPRFKLMDKQKSIVSLTAFHKHSKVIRILLRYPHFSPLEKDEKKRDPITASILIGSADCFLELMRDNRIVFGDSNWSTYIHLLFMRGDFNLVQALFSLEISDSQFSQFIQTACLSQRYVGFSSQISDFIETFEADIARQRAKLRIKFGSSSNFIFFFFLPFYPFKLKNKNKDKNK
jgi:ankyrin repeat protein